MGRLATAWDDIGMLILLVWFNNEKDGRMFSKRKEALFSGSTLSLQPMDPGFIQVGVGSKFVVGSIFHTVQ